MPRWAPASSSSPAPTSQRPPSPTPLRETAAQSAVSTLRRPEGPHHLLVTNDFPPKIGGIQSFLWELWRRLPPTSFTVLTVGHPGAEAFDREQEFRIERLPLRMLLPTPGLARRTAALADEIGAGLVVFDPAVPVGILGPRLGLPYGVVLHGAEVSVPANLPLARAALARVLRGARWAVANSAWVAGQAARVAGGSIPPVVTITPGVDHLRFCQLAPPERAAARRRLGLASDATVVLSVGRLVARKNMAMLIEAVGMLAPQRPGLCLLIAGAGRQGSHLGRLAAAVNQGTGDDQPRSSSGSTPAGRSTGASVRMLGQVADADLPALYGAADIFAQPTVTRWSGLEQEGFGMVFVEAAACGIPALAGRSGGAGEAVLDGVTGLVVDRPTDPVAVADALRQLLDDPVRRQQLGRQARQRVESCFTYDQLAKQLSATLALSAPGNPPPGGPDPGTTVDSSSTGGPE